MRAGPSWLLLAACCRGSWLAGRVRASADRRPLRFTETGWQPTPYAIISVIAEIVTVLLVVLQPYVKEPGPARATTCQRGLRLETNSLGLVGDPGIKRCDIPYCGATGAALVFTEGALSWPGPEPACG